MTTTQNSQSATWRTLSDLELGSVLDLHQVGRVTGPADQEILDELHTRAMMEHQRHHQASDQLRGIYQGFSVERLHQLVLNARGFRRATIMDQLHAHAIADYAQQAAAGVTAGRPILALNDLASSLTLLVEQWDRQADQLHDRIAAAPQNWSAPRTTIEETRLRACAAEVREILGRLA